MRYIAFATDYDGTLAEGGRVDPAAIEALERLRGSGRRLILVTGRGLDDLGRVFPRFDLFERVVAENGALLFRPDRRESRVLCPPPPPAFLEQLRRRGVPAEAGSVIVATLSPHDAEVRKAIQDLGLELQLIFNKGSVMVLPSGVDKATGLQAALEGMGIPAHNVVAIGDGENDCGMLELAGCGVAVANAVQSLREQADAVMSGDHGRGVVELVERLLADDLTSLGADLIHRLRRR
jgi:hydroxymethylpyrimidine pyrophosphatase-like HAD family hydrolase